MVEFVELESAAGAILLGFPDSAAWAFGLMSDDDGNISAEFQALGSNLLVESSKSSRGKNVRRLEAVCIEGPDVNPFRAFLPHGEPQG